MRFIHLCLLIAFFPLIASGSDSFEASTGLKSIYSTRKLHNYFGVHEIWVSKSSRSFLFVIKNIRKNPRLRNNQWYSAAKGWAIQITNGARATALYAEGEFTNQQLKQIQKHYMHSRSRASAFLENLILPRACAEVTGGSNLSGRILGPPPLFRGPEKLELNATWTSTCFSVWAKAPYPD